MHSEELPQCRVTHEGFQKHIDDGKGWRTAILGVVFTVIIQVGAFLFMWGGLTTTVSEHSKNIERVMNKLDNIKLVGYAQAEDIKNGYKTMP